jgi:hypothetical protein
MKLWVVHAVMFRLVAVAALLVALARGGWQPLACVVAGVFVAVALAFDVVAFEFWQRFQDWRMLRQLRRSRR